MAPASSKEFLDIKANYRVWIHSETRTWHDNNTAQVFSYELCEIFKNTDFVEHLRTAPYFCIYNFTMENRSSRDNSYMVIPCEV